MRTTRTRAPVGRHRASPATDAGSAFYETAIGEEYQRGGFAWSHRAEDHPFYREFIWLLDTRGLRGRKALEVGAGRGAFQDEVLDYTAVDLVAAAAKWLHKPFVQAEATSLPFEDGTFDIVWTHYVLEHVARPEQMMAEIARVTRPGGYVMISARWQAGPWLADGYPVRPFSDFDWRGKLVKASVPVRSAVWFRALSLLPRRMTRTMGRLRRPTRLHYRRLRPNFSRNWMPDATAATSVEPHEVYCWYVSRGFRCLNHPTLLRALTIRTGPLMFQAPTS